MDWAFSSPYKGTISPLRKTLEDLAVEFPIPEDLLERLSSEIGEEKELTAHMRRDTES